jgi:hypothetical protein
MECIVSRRTLIILITAFIITAAVIILSSLALTPQETNPAVQVAVTFWNAAEQGDDAVALPLLSPALQEWVAANCPAGSVSRCIQTYSPPEWGKLLSAVFRRSAPVGRIWNVDVIATYELETGVSGVCAHFRVEPTEGGTWQITEWAGFLWCGDPASRSMATNPETPNRVP